jgi:signal transduction histidine kinase/ActR/RegA family two-component response regulator
MNAKQTIQSRLKTTCQALITSIGFTTTACLVLMFAITLLITLKSSSILSTTNQELVDQSSEQTLRSVKIASSVDEIELALRTQNWDAIEPAFNKFADQFQLWSTSHERLSSRRKNQTIAQSSQLTIAEHFDRLDFTTIQITQSISELSLVSESVIRRAPYVNQSSQSRFFASASAMRKHIPIYIDTMSEINTLYQAHALQSSEQRIASMKQWTLLLLLSLVLLPLIAIAPRIGKLQSKIQSLEDQLTEFNKNAAHRWSLLASLGHEFRNPMSSIIGFASVLKNEHQDQQTKVEHAQSIHSAGTGLMSLIEDILEMSAIEAGQIDINPHTTNLPFVLNAIESRYQPIADAKGLKLSTHLDESAPESITTDAQRLTQLLSKIIENAIEFTDTGSVAIHATLEESDQQPSLTFRIVDTGIGINHDQIPRIFDPFQRIETGLDRKHPGAGLGLSLARAIAQQLGGDITIESAPGAGCFVSVSINPGDYIMNENTTQHDEPIPVPSNPIDRTILESKRVLIVEDAEDNQRLLSHHLTKAGCTVQLANNGQAGIDRINEAIESDTPFDLILMDMQMPILDGFEAAAKLREDGITTPIVGVTAFISNDDRTRCLQAGCDAYLAKPVDQSDLLDTCSEQLRKPQSQHKEAA